MNDMVTISVHNGSTVCRAHNLRLPGVLKAQPHIDPNGAFEVWHDESEAAAYKRLFQTAVDEYNSKQTRSDRIIKNYHTKVTQSGQQSTCYELIVGVYGSDCDPKIGYRILRQYYDEWAKRNPRLELIGAYYHSDETGDPHVHLDYVAVADGYTTGMKTRASLRRALEQMGYQKAGKETAQIAWERSEQEYLEKLCNQHGLTVNHPGGRKKHFTVEEYKELREEERQHFIVEKAVELHEKPTLSTSRVTVDAAALKTLKERERQYLLHQTEPSIRTRSAVAARQQHDALKKASDLYEREQALANEKRTLEKDRETWAEERRAYQKAFKAVLLLLEEISAVLHRAVARFPLPKALRDDLLRLIHKIDETLGINPRIPYEMTSNELAPSDK